ncbi:hypothetical protein R6G85_05475, partial [Actinotignum urinale]|nr:hypothetical protein [Actinotignum urinale]
GPTYTTQHPGPTHGTNPHPPILSYSPKDANTVATHTYTHTHTHTYHTSLISFFHQNVCLRTYHITKHSNTGE